MAWHGSSRGCPVKHVHACTWLPPPAAGRPPALHTRISTRPPSPRAPPAVGITPHVPRTAAHTLSDDWLTAAAPSPAPTPLRPRGRQAKAMQGRFSVEFGKAARKQLFVLDPDFKYLNHGSYGAAFRYGQRGTPVPPGLALLRLGSRRAIAVLGPGQHCQARPAHGVCVVGVHSWLADARTLPAPRAHLPARAPARLPGCPASGWRLRSRRGTSSSWSCSP